jgi:hypothetical protein
MTVPTLILTILSIATPALTAAIQSDEIHFRIKNGPECAQIGDDNALRFTGDCDSKDTLFAFSPRNGQLSYLNDETFMVAPTYMVKPPALVLNRAKDQAGVTFSLSDKGLELFDKKHPQGGACVSGDKDVLSVVPCDSARDSNAIEIVKVTE